MVEQKYRMVDNPDGSGTKVREYYYVDAEGNEVDAPEGVDVPEEEAEAGPTYEERQQADADERAAAIAADDAARQAWAEAGGDRIGPPPDPSVNETAPDITAPPGDEAEVPADGDEAEDSSESEAEPA